MLKGMSPDAWSTLTSQSMEEKDDNEEMVKDSKDSMNSESRFETGDPISEAHFTEVGIEVVASSSYTPGMTCF